MRLVNIFLMLAIMIIPATAQTPQIRIFNDWTVTCDAFADCAATTRFNFDPADTSSADFALQIARQPYETFWEISLLANAALPADTTTAEVSIENVTTTFSAPEEFAAFGALNNYYFIGGKAQAIMDQMTPASAINIRFTDVDGISHTADFSLSGLTAALLWIDEQQDRIGSERVAETPPADKKRVTTREPAPLSDELRTRHAANTDCEPLEDLIHGEDIMSFRMNATDTLHMIPCWAGAYNFGYMVYVDGQYGSQQIYFASYTDALGWTGTPAVVNPGFDEKTNRLFDFYKGRGLGDCGTSGLWQWANWGFKLLEYRAKSACDDPENPGDFPVVYRAPDYLPPAEN